MLQQLDKVHNDDDEMDKTSPINMSSDEEQEHVPESNVKGRNGNHQEKEEKIMFISSINTPGIVKEDSLVISRRDT